MTTERFDRFSSIITQIWRDLQKLKNREMLKFGLRGSHAMCLFYLRQNPGGLTVAELSALCETDKGAVSRTAAELEDLGYILCPETTDKRKYRAKLTLTPAGSRIAEKLDIVIAEGVEKAGAGLDPPAREGLYSSLELISKNLQNMTSEQEDSIGGKD